MAAMSSNGFSQFLCESNFGSQKLPHFVLFPKVYQYNFLRKRITCFAKLPFGDSVLSASTEQMRSPLNDGVLPAKIGEFPSLRLGTRITVDPPVVLAPMAGITNAPYRQLCEEEGAGLCVSEMVIAHLLVQGNSNTCKLASFGDNERIRSIQLYGTDATSLGEATRILVQEARVDHIDLNFGCPVRKIISKGGGAAVPENPKLFASLVGACTKAANGQVPVTVKMRLGLKNGKSTFLEAGLAAQDAGASWVALHARTAEQLYAPPVHWEAIAELANRLSIPVLGNGDVLECWDALRLMRSTGAAGVVIGRGCLGRPWLFRELASIFLGKEPEVPPNLIKVLSVAHRHLKALSLWLENDYVAILQMRRLIPLYLYGFSSAITLQKQLMEAKTITEWEDCINSDIFDPLEPFPFMALRYARLKGGALQG